MFAIFPTRVCAASLVWRLSVAAIALMASVNCAARLVAADNGSKTITNSIGMKLTLIPRGEFMMGSGEKPEELARAFPGTSAENYSREFPQHKVRITKPFYMGTYAVTKGQFRKFIEATNYQTDEKAQGMGGWGYIGGGGVGGPFFAQTAEFSWRNTGYDQTDEHPVVNVTWSDAVAFCDWLSKKEHKTYRLPTEAEWEYAARAGTKTRYFFGNNPEDMAKYGNCADATATARFPDWKAIKASDGYLFTAPVGKFRPNQFGLYDMAGNSFTWCSDWYDEHYYEKSPPMNDPTGPAEGTDRVMRGGSWGCGPSGCLSAERGGAVPTKREHEIGLRVVRVR